jgi:hypothetical protein
MNNFKHTILLLLQCNVVKIVLFIFIYRDVFKAVDVFRALYFTASGASPAAKLTQILPVTQHA